MQKSTFSPHYAAFREALFELRKRSGLNQRRLAQKIGREQSFVARVELGERRLDVVEFYWYCLACRTDPVNAAARIMKMLKGVDRDRSARKSPDDRAMIGKKK